MDQTRDNIVTCKVIMLRYSYTSSQIFQHYNDVVMGAIASQIIAVSIV